MNSSTKDNIAGLVLHVLNEAKNASVSSSVVSSNAGVGDFDDPGVEHGEAKSVLATPRKL